MRKKQNLRKKLTPKIIKPKPEVVVFIEPKVIAIEELTMTIKETYEFALNIKKHSLNNTSYINFEGRINRFKRSFDEGLSITSVTRKVTNQYLNGILETSSPRNRNNSRIDLSSLFEVLANNEIIPDNFIKKIIILKAKPERNKTYTPEMQLKIYAHLETNDPLLLLFIKLICYNFLRPVEVCRLKVGDLDINDKKRFGCH